MPNVLRFKWNLKSSAFSLARKFRFIDLVRVFLSGRLHVKKNKKNNKKKKLEKNNFTHDLRFYKTILIKIGGLASKHLFVILYLKF